MRYTYARDPNHEHWFVKLACAFADHRLWAQEITGIVFAYDEATECLMLTQPGTHGGVNNLRLLKKSVVKVCSADTTALLRTVLGCCRAWAEWGLLGARHVSVDLLCLYAILCCRKCSMQSHLRSPHKRPCLLLIWKGQNNGKRRPWRYAHITKADTHCTEAACMCCLLHDGSSISTSIDYYITLYVPCAAS